MILGDNASSRIFLWDKCNYYQKKSVSNYERVNTFKKHGVFTVMDDKQIINLFFQRDEDAINAVDEKYGSKLNALAANILQSREDGLECVNDTYMKAWNSIPPARPEYLFAFLAASARNIAIDMIRKNNAGKRQAKVVELTKELEECIGDGGLQTHLDKEDIGEMLSHFLETVDKNKRIIFLRRYWYSDSIKDISERMQMSESAVKVTLHRTRKELRRYLESEGLYL